MANYTIAEDFELPSKGVIYGEAKVAPTVKLRSWTGREELRRLNSSQLHYKSLSDLIQDCIINKDEIGVPVYDMCLGDFEFLLHRLRVVTYGEEYPVVIRCPYCGEVVENNINLYDLGVNEIDRKEWEEALTVMLPKSKCKVTLRYTTPRMLDEIADKVEELKVEGEDTSVLLKLVAHIEKIDGEKKDFSSLKNFIYSLPVSDFNLIDKKINTLDEIVGLDKKVMVKCNHCKEKIPTTFQYNREFFRPEIY